MKTNFKKMLGLLMFSVVLLSACKEEIFGPLYKGSGKPSTVSNVKVVNGNGDATITYTLPSQEDLLYIKANYTLSNGVKREVKSSFYGNSVYLDGFTDTTEYSVQLTAVNKGEESSDPVIVKVKPLISALLKTFKTLTLAGDFGGLNISAKNDYKAELGFVLLVFDSTKNEYIDVKKSYYSKKEDISYTFRTYSANPRKFAVYIRDKYLNKSDTIFQTVTPIFEIALNKKIWAPLILPSDDAMNYSGRQLKFLWDGGFTSWNNTAATVQNDLDPLWFSWSLGTTSKLSRFSIQSYGTAYYSAKGARFFELWGSNDPNPNGSFDGWIKLGDYEVIKPSGLADGDTDEDKAAGKAGFTFDVPFSSPAVKYLRFKSIKNWSGTSGLFIMEFTAFGNQN